MGSNTDPATTLCWFISFNACRLHEMPSPDRNSIDRFCFCWTQASRSTKLLYNLDKNRLWSTCSSRSFTDHEINGAIEPPTLFHWHRAETRRHFISLKNKIFFLSIDHYIINSDRWGWNAVIKAQTGRSLWKYCVARRVLLTQESEINNKDGDSCLARSSSHISFQCFWVSTRETRLDEHVNVHWCTESTSAHSETWLRSSRRCSLCQAPPHPSTPHQPDLWGTIHS